MELIIHLIVTE